MRKIIQPKNVVKPASDYAQAVLLPTGGERLIISGQVGQSVDGKTSESYETQARQAWQNLLAILKEAGFAKEHLVKITVFDVAPGNVAAYRMIRDEVLGGHLVASTYLIVSALASPAFLTEIEAEAVRP